MEEDSEDKSSGKKGSKWKVPIIITVGLIGILIIIGIFLITAQQSQNTTPNIIPIIYQQLLDQESDQGTNPVIITEQTIPGTITLISPADGTTYDHYPRTTYLRWSTPTDVAVDHYYVEIQCYYSGTWGTWHTDTTENTWYTTDFVGAQPGRWRVIANLGNGEWGPWTEYRTFSYTV